MKGTSFSVNTALPDTLEEFSNIFIDQTTGKVNNIEKFKRRIIGLTSYFRSAQEELLPKYDKITNFNVIKLPMSDYQFQKYEIERQEERKSEKPTNKAAQAGNELFSEPNSTYRIFSRLFCNYVMPTPPGRPKPKSVGAIKEIDVTKEKSREEKEKKEKSKEVKK